MYPLFFWKNKMRSTQQQKRNETHRSNVGEGTPEEARLFDLLLRLFNLLFLPKPRLNYLLKKK